MEFGDQNIRNKLEDRTASSHQQPQNWGTQRDGRLTTPLGSPTIYSQPGILRGHQTCESIRSQTVWGTLMRKRIHMLTLVLLAAVAVLLGHSTGGERKRKSDEPASPLPV